MRDEQATNSKSLMLYPRRNIRRRSAELIVSQCKTRERNGVCAQPTASPCSCQGLWTCTLGAGRASGSVEHHPTHMALKQRSHQHGGLNFWEREGPCWLLSLCVGTSAAPALPERGEPSWIPAAPTSPFPPGRGRQAERAKPRDCEMPATGCAPAR